MRLAFAVLLSCFAALAAASPYLNTTFCEKVGTRICPIIPVAVACGAKNCFSFESGKRALFINERNVIDEDANWTELPVTSDFPQFIYSVHASATSTAVIAGGFSPGSPSDDAVLFSNNPDSEVFFPVPSTPGPILSVSAIPNSNGEFGAFFVRKANREGAKTESGIHIISSSGKLVRTVVFDEFAPFVPTSFAFAGTDMWFATVSVTERDSAVYRTSDGGNYWSIVNAEVGNKSILGRIACTAANCIAVDFGGDITKFHYAPVSADDMMWAVFEVPTTSNYPFQVTSLNISPGGTRAVATGYFIGAVPARRALSILSVRTRGYPDFYPLRHPYVGMYSDSTFTSETTGVLIGHASEGFPAVVGATAVFSEGEDGVSVRQV